MATFRIFSFQKTRALLVTYATAIASGMHEHPGRTLKTTNCSFLVSAGFSDPSSSKYNDSETITDDGDLITIAVVARTARDTIRYDACYLEMSHGFERMRVAVCAWRLS